MTLRLRPGSRKPAFSMTCSDAEGDLDLTTATSVVLVAEQGGVEVFSDSDPSGDRAAGEIAHDWAAGETDDEGRIFLHAVVKFGDEVPIIFPPYGEHAVDIG